MYRGKNHYDKLGVTTDADAAKIKTGYKQLTLKWHPDMINKLGPVYANKERYQNFMSEVFQIVKEAYEVLSNPTDRQRYNVTLRTGFFTANLNKNK